MKKIVCVCLLVGLLGGCAKSGGVSSQAEPDISVETILDKVRAAYGEEYLPDMEIPPELLESEFGLSADLYTQAVGEMPMMSTFPDRVVIVRAAEGRADDVEAALQSAREAKISSELQYPVNIPKTNATKVVRHGGYVAFFLVGAPLSDFNMTEEDVAEYMEEEVQKAVAAFDSFFE